MAAVEITTLTKPEIITSFRESDTDTGSPRVQVALLTKRIKQLSAHLLKHKGDQHSRRGLLGMVGQRRRLFQYIEKKEGAQAVTKLKNSLGL